MLIGLRPDDRAALAAEGDASRLAARPRLIGIGMGKTGTHALASLFAPVRAAHEAEAARAIDLILAYEAGTADWRDMRRFVLDRDQRLGLTVDVSNLNLFFVDVWLAVAPDTRFVLTVREPRSWLDSILNHYLCRPPTDAWRAFAARRFGHDDAPHPAEEQVLADAGLHPLDGYLSYWRTHMEKALGTVPAERLLVVPFDRIATEAARIATFAGLSAADIDPSRINEYRNPAKRPILDQIPSSHVESCIRRWCGPFMGMFAPHPELAPGSPSATASAP